MKKLNICVLWIFLSTIIFPYSQESEVKDGGSIFGDLTARQIGPALMSGRINDLEIHPTNHRIIYLGAAGGGVWKSNDGGATFNPIFDDHIQSIGTVTLIQMTQIKPYMLERETWTRNSVSYGDGIYKSSDGGANWKHIGLKIQNEFQVSLSTQKIQTKSTWQLLVRYGEIMRNEEYSNQKMEVKLGKKFFT